MFAAALLGALIAMRVTRSKTDYRLLIWIAAPLFAVSWLLPPWHKSFAKTRIGNLCWLYDFYDQGQTSWGNFIEHVVEDVILSALVACLVAWIIQSAVVVIRTKRREKNETRA